MLPRSSFSQVSTSRADTSAAQPEHIDLSGLTFYSGAPATSGPASAFNTVGIESAGETVAVVLDHRFHTALEPLPEAEPVAQPAAAPPPPFKTHFTQS